MPYQRLQYVLKAQKQVSGETRKTIKLTTTSTRLELLPTRARGFLAFRARGLALRRRYSWFWSLWRC